MMIKYKNLQVTNWILSPIIIISFLSIRISNYMSAGSYPLFNIFSSIKNGDNTLVPVIWIIGVAVHLALMILSSVLFKKLPLILFTLLFVAYWYLIFHLYGYFFDTELYIKSSIPFLMSSFFLLILCGYGLYNKKKMSP